MMNILHIYPKDDSMTANYVGMLVKAMDGKVRSRMTDEMTEFRQMCKDEKPDVVHLHGLSTFSMGSLRKVVTPHGRQLNIGNAYVVIARSQMEARKLEAPRVEIVRNPLLTKTTNADETAGKLMHIYQKVTDSNVLELMNDDTRQTLRILLKAGICGDSRWVENIETPHPDWRQLLIYAYYEQVDRLVRKGAQVINIDIPHIVVDKSTAYVPKDYRRLDETDDFSVPNLVTKMADGEMTLLRLCELDEALRRDDMDDEKLMKELEENGHSQLFSCLLQLLVENTLFDEGFMPCPPVDNHETARLREKLNQHLKI